MSKGLIENWTNYSMRLKKTSNPDFFKIRNLSSEFVTKLPQEAQNELYNEMNRGSLPLGSEPEMSMYMFAYGKMHYEKLLKAFEHLPKTFFDNEIEIIDYGCGQAMGLIAYADYIKQKGYNQKITNITLIEPSKLTIGRAILHANQIFPDVTVNAICKSLDDLQDNDIQTDANTSKLHIFSNIIDVELFSLNQLSDFIKLKFDGTNQFVCVSPYFGSNNSRTNRLDEFMNLIASSKDYSENIGKEDWINGWTCSIRVFAMLKIRFLKNNADAEEILSLYMNAENGDPEAQNNLGKCYDKGKGVEKDLFLSVKWFRLAAEQGYSFAQFNLGICYAHGEGVGKDYFEAVKWYRLAALQGVSAAQCNLGRCYRNGEGVEKDYFEAVRWYSLAAEQGVSVAQCNLGICYKNGEGVEKDYSQAVKWYRLAADQGNVTAQYYLGKCYNYGEGIERDYKQAVIWYQLAAENGNADAQNILGKCYLKSDIDKAEKWFRLAAENGNADAQNYLGNESKPGILSYSLYQNECFYIDIHERNPMEALSQKKEALNKYNAGILEKDIEAYNWYHLAAAKNHAEAQFNLGNCYFYGKGVTIDKSEALKWYKLSAKQGYESAIEKIKDLSTFTQNANNNVISESSNFSSTSKNIKNNNPDNGIYAYVFILLFILFLILMFISPS